MPRTKRSWTSELSGSFHIISRITGGEFLLGPKEKEYFLLLLERYAKGFYVDVHRFCIMSNHFHILATGGEEKAGRATQRDLIGRYKKIYGKEYEPPRGRQMRDGTVVMDEDGGMERLRLRLTSVSRFTQELKQSFSRWYNRKNRRQGYFWADRFKGVIISKGEAQLVCGAYIDLNPIRAKMVKRPEEYRWSSIGLEARSPGRSKSFLKPIEYKPVSRKGGRQWYRRFVYEAGHLSKGNSGRINQKQLEEVRGVMGRMGIGKSLRFRLRNLTEGYAFGTKELIEEVQKLNKRKNIKARPVFQEKGLYSTRVLGKI